MKKNGSPNPSRFSRLMALCIALAIFAAACGSEPDSSVASDPDEIEEVDQETDDVAIDENPTDEVPADEISTDDVAADEISTDEDPADEAPLSASGLDVSLFFDGTIVGEPTTEPCTLSDGTESTCYRITVAGDPVSYETGPFCPTSITDTAEAGGLWIDGNGVYDVDGEFIANLAEFYDDDNWLLYDEDGNINVTETAEEFDAAARPDVDESLQNHCVEGRLEWLANGEPITSTVLIPVEPVAAGGVNNTNGNLGVTLDGVVIAQSAPVDAILGAYTIAAFDDCGGHYNPNDGYHLHGAVGCSETGEAEDGETPMFAYAMDGFPLHSPLDDPDAADLDECGGHDLGTGYHYHANNAGENLVVSCLMGLTASNGDDDERGGERPERPERPAGE